MLNVMSHTGFITAGFLQCELHHQSPVYNKSQTNILSSFLQLSFCPVKVLPILSFIALKVGEVLVYNCDWLAD